LKHLAVDLRELWRYRAIIWVLAGRQLRVRYKNSAIGMLWSLVIPLFQVFAITVAVGYIMGSGPKNYSAFVLCAMLPWTFFSSAVLDGSSSILAYSDLLKKVYIPREVFPIASVAANLIHFFMAFIVFVLFRYIYLPLAHGWPGWPPREVLLFPAVLGVEIMFVLGVTFILAAWTTFYEDVKYLVQTTMNLLLYLLPIMYFAENIYYAHRIPAHSRSLIYHVYLANPLCWVITAFKQIFFTPVNIAPRGGAVILSAPFDYRYFALNALLSFLVLVVGYIHFNSMKWKFAERP